MPQASSGKPLRFWLLLIGLIALAKDVLETSIDLLGFSAPEKM